MVFINGHAVLHSQVPGPAQPGINSQKYMGHCGQLSPGPRLESGSVSALNSRMLLGPCSKISAYWHHHLCNTKILSNFVRL